MPPFAGSLASVGDFLAAFLSQALGLFAFEHRGEVVAVDGIRLRLPSDPPPRRGRPPDLHCERVEDYRHGEPRIAVFVGLFQNLCTHLTFVCRGTPVEIDAVRLANLSQWSRYHYDSLFVNLSALSSACSANCVFCYRHGSKDGRLLNLSRRVLTLQEAKTRARYWQPGKKLGLPFRRADDGELFTNRRALDILDIARRADPGTVFTLTTNGDYLDEQAVDRLTAYRPLVVTLSVNTADAERRRELMRSAHPENGIRAVELLRDAGIPCVGSIVADQRLGLDDLARTIRYLDARQAMMIRILLPGYTKHSADRALPGLEPWWRGVTDLALALRGEVECPILVSPALYWDTGVRPTVEGVYRHSVARRAGLRIGDVVLAVNGQTVCTKLEVLQLLERPSLDGKVASLRVERGPQVFDVVLDPAATAGDGTPTGPAVDLRYRRYGIFMNQGLDMTSLVWIRRYLKRFSRPRRVLLFSTPLARPHLLTLATFLEDFDQGHDVRSAIAEQAFWGGNILIGDVHVVGDYVRKIARLSSKGWTPDIVFIPDSFLTGKWGLDVVGQSFRRIERETRVRTVLVPTTRIME